MNPYTLSAMWSCKYSQKMWHSVYIQCFSHFKARKFCSICLSNPICMLQTWPDSEVYAPKQLQIELQELNPFQGRLSFDQMSDQFDKQHRGSAVLSHEKAPCDSMSTVSRDIAFTYSQMTNLTHVRDRSMGMTGCFGIDTSSCGMQSNAESPEFDIVTSAKHASRSIEKHSACKGDFRFQTRARRGDTATCYSDAMARCYLLPLLSIAPYIYSQQSHKSSSSQRFNSHMHCSHWFASYSVAVLDNVTMWDHKDRLSSAHKHVPCQGESGWVRR